MADEQFGGKVPVINPYGQFGTIDETELGQAVKDGGFRVATENEINKYVDKKKYGEGFTNSLKATAYGFLRGASGGVSDYIAKTGLADIDEMRGLKENKPIASTVGEIGGFGAALAVPGLGEEAAGAKALGAADLINPVKAVSKLGRATSEAALPALQSGTKSLLGTGVGKETVSKILSHGAADALGSAVEAGALGLGQSVSEHALGDPDLNAEKVMSNVGYSALFGGALGGLLGAGTEAIKGAKNPFSGRFISELDKPGVEMGDFKSIINSSEMPEVEKKGILDGLFKKKKNATEIEQAAQEIGAPVLESQISDSVAVQKADSALINGAPTYAGLRRQRLAADGYNKATGAIEGALGKGIDTSETAIGNQLKESLTTKLNSQRKVMDDLYSNIKTQFPTIPVDESSLVKGATNLTSLPEFEQFARLSPKNPKYKFLTETSELLKNAKTVDDIKFLSKQIGDDVSALGNTPEMKRLGALVRNELKEIEQSSLVKFADENASKFANPENIQQLMFERKMADDSYKEFITKGKELAKGLGKKKIYGAADLVDFIEEMNPQQLAKKLFQDKNVEFVQFVGKHFPEEMQMVRDYQVGKIYQSSIKNGAFSPAEALKQVNNLQPEIRDALFSPAQLKQMRAGQTYLESLPKNFNPSNTDNQRVFREAFEIGGKDALGLALGGIKGLILGKVGAEARDLALEQFVKTFGVDKLIKLERAGLKTNNAINDAAQKFFKFVPAKQDVSSYIGSKLGTNSPEHIEKSNKEFDHMVAHLQELQNNPSQMIDKLEAATKSVYDVAPNLSGSLQAGTIRATDFLISKMPSKGHKRALSPSFKLSNAELSKFQRYIRTVEKPLSSLDQLRNHTLTPETIETLNVVYPKLYGHMKSVITDKLTDFLAKNKPEQIPYAYKQSLSFFLGEDLMDSLAQENIASNQMVLAGNGQQQAQNQMDQKVRTSQDGLSKLSLANNALTPLQKSQMRMS